MGDEILNAIVLAADGAALATPGYFWGAIVDGAGAVSIYDNASAASGKKIATITGSAATTTIPVMLARPVKCLNGIYVDLTGNVVTVFFEAA